MHSTTPLFALLIVFAAINNGLCLKCYQCTSTNNPSCKDPFNNSKAVLNVECASSEVTNFYNSYLGAIMPAPAVQNSPRYCVKMTIAGTLGDTIIRTCVEGPSNNFNKTCVELEKGTGFTSFASTRQALKYCNVCDGDSCNSATSNSVSVLLGLAAASVLAYLTH